MGCTASTLGAEENCFNVIHIFDSRNHKDKLDLAALKVKKDVASNEEYQIDVKSKQNVASVNAQPSDSNDRQREYNGKKVKDEVDYLLVSCNQFNRTTNQRSF